MSAVGDDLAAAAPADADRSDAETLKKDLSDPSVASLYFDLLGEIESQLIKPMAAYCETAGRLHSALLKSLNAGIHEHQSEEDGRRIWQGIRSYARPLRAQVLGPLGEQFSRLAIGQGVDRLSSVFFLEENLPRKRGWRWKRALRRLEERIHRQVAADVYALEQTAHELTSALTEALEKTDLPGYQLPSSDEWTEASEAVGLTTGAAHESNRSTVQDAALTRLGVAAENFQATLSICAQSSLSQLMSAAGDLRQDEVAGEAHSEQSPEPADTHKQEGDTGAGPWLMWHEQAACRLQFCQALLSMHEEFQSAEERLLSTALSVAEQSFSRYDEVAEKLRASREELDAVFSDRGPADRPSAYVVIRAIRRKLDSAANTVDDDLVEGFKSFSARQALQDSVVEALHGLVQAGEACAAQFEMHSVLRDGEGLAKPHRRSRSVDLRGLPDRLQARLRPALTGMATGLDAELVKLRQDDQLISSVVRFHQGAAIEELEEINWWRATESEVTESVEASRDLALAGIDRSQEALSKSKQRIRRSVARAAPEIHKVLKRARMMVMKHAAAESRPSQALANLHQVREHTQKTLASEVTSARQRLRVIGRSLRKTFGRRAKQIVHMGQVAVGVADAADTPLSRTAAALTRLEAQRESLPGVYRRLFTFHPLSDPSLAAGCRVDVNAVTRHTIDWQRGVTHPLVIAGRPGRGITTLLNVMRGTRLRQARVHEISLSRRILTEDQLVENFRQPLDSLGLSADSLDTLEGLSGAILAAAEPEQLQVCILEHLEHLYIRTIGGAGLVGLALRFMAATDSRIVWIATVSSDAWQAIRHSEPAACQLVSFHEMSSLGRDELERIIDRRHSRSGLDLHFEVPEGNALLNRRLSKAKLEEQQQEILRRDYFDKLFAACGGNVSSALFYWLLSIKYDEATSTVCVTPTVVLDQNFLGRLPLAHAFTLKSFLEHGTLNVQEHATVANQPISTSVAQFESLADAFLIEPVNAAAHAGPGLDTSRIDDDMRYRIRSLMTEPVIRYLRTKNIVH